MSYLTDHLAEMDALDDLSTALEAMLAHLYTTHEPDPREVELLGTLLARSQVTLAHHRRTAELEARQ